MSAVAHVLTLVAALAGGVAGGTQILERHPALGSLLRALFVRVSNRSVRRAACAVLFRASHWQALGRDASDTAAGGDRDDGAAAAAAVAAIAVGAGPAAATAAAVAAASTAARRASARAATRSSGLAHVLLGSLRTDLARVKTTSSARCGGGGGGGRGRGLCVGGGGELSPMHRARGDATPMTDKNNDCSGNGEGLVPVVVPRLHLVEVTEFVAGLVHVMLESAPTAAAAASTTGAVGTEQHVPPVSNGAPCESTNGSAPAIPLQQQQLLPDIRVGGARAPALPAKPPQPSQLFPAVPSTGAAATAVSAGDGRTAVGSIEGVEGGGGGGVGGADLPDHGSSAAAAEWLLEEAARRLAGHEFTETFK